MLQVLYFSLGLACSPQFDAIYEKWQCVQTRLSVERTLKMVEDSKIRSAILDKQVEETVRRSNDLLREAGLPPLHEATPKPPQPLPTKPPG